MTQSRNQSKTTSIQSKGIEGINRGNKQGKLLGNKILLNKYKRFKREYESQGKHTKYWDSKIRELEKLISKNSDWNSISFKTEIRIYKRAIALFFCVTKLDIWTDTP